MAVQLSDSEAQLGEALKTLEERWQQTAGDWQDVSRTEFDKEHLEDMRRACKAGQRGMCTVSELLKRVMRECS